MRFASGLRAISLATLVALGGSAVAAVPATATDPASDPIATASPTPSPTPDPAATPTPEPVASPADPSASPDPAPASPSASPSPAAAAVVAPTLSAAAKLKARYARAARIAIAQRFDRYVRGAIGPSAFDCSGLVRYSYRRAGISGRLGGGHSARAMLYWARLHGKTSRSNPRVGDVIIYGNGSHAAIYIGHGRVISALNPRAGIRITGMRALTARFTAIIKTR